VMAVVPTLAAGSGFSEKSAASARPRGPAPGGSPAAAQHVGQYAGRGVVGAGSGISSSSSRRSGTMARWDARSTAIRARSTPHC